jgi:Zn finger protein HypA/HybF involved in hydrogenase expression
MIALMAAVRRRTELPEQTEHPQDSNVVAWSDLLINHFCAGQSNDRLRQYLKATTERAWHLVNWLTHHTNANKTAALIAVHAVEAIVIHMTHLLTREGRDRTDQCPSCGSRALRTFFDIEIEPDGAYFEDCGECDWNNHPGYENDLDDLDDLDPVAISEAQLQSARSVHEMWVRNGNESMIAFTATSVAALEEHISKLREETDSGR